MAHTVNSLNPTTTAEVYAPDFRGESLNTFNFSLPTTAGVGFALPKIKTYPATFMFSNDGARTLKTPIGFVTAHNASSITVHGNGTGFSASASTTADHVVLSISSGVISCTNAGTNAATAATVYSVVRID